MDPEQEQHERDRVASREDDYRRELLRYQAHRHATNAALVSGTLAALLAIGVLVSASLSGVELLAGFGILAVVVITFYALVFGRELRLKARARRAGIDLDIGKRT